MKKLIFYIAKADGSGKAYFNDGTVRIDSNKNVRTFP